jgi:hypothetical protein
MFASFRPAMITAIEGHLYFDTPSQKLAVNPRQALRINLPEMLAVFRRNSWPDRGVFQLGQILHSGLEAEDRTGPQAMEIDNENLALPRGRKCIAHSLGNVKVAQIPVLVISITVVEQVAQSGQFGKEAFLPPTEILRR